MSMFNEWIAEAGGATVAEPPPLFAAPIQPRACGL